MYKLIHFNSINSTNVWAKENLEKLSDKTIVFADIQSEGHGRFQRKWISDIPDNIYCSIVLKPEKKKYLHNLTQYLSIVLCKTIEEYNVKPEIKWPNDVLVNKKKIAGILCEFTKSNTVVLGIGINLNMKQNDLNRISQPATALNIETSKIIDRDCFFKNFINKFFDEYDELIEKGFLFIKDDYNKRVKFIETTITINYEKNKEKVFAKEINDDGFLVVIDKNKKERTILSGDLQI